ncbi:MAG: glycerophosphodiester phosphodiesterase [Candidatus Micrarchaeia archaeon]
MLKIGHRGARGVVAENTIKSFEEAIKEGVNAVELDVRETKNKKLVVFHDEKVDKLTNAKGYVRDFTLEEIKKLRVNGVGEIPTLEEALDFLKNKKVKVLIEIKEPGTEPKVLEEIKKRKMEKNCIIVSFYKEALEKVKQIDEKIETGLIFVKDKEAIENALKIKANYILPLYHFTHSSDIEKAHKNGLKVIVWTINDKEEAKRFKEKGVDGIATDFPEVLKDLC